MVRASNKLRVFLIYAALALAILIAFEPLRQNDFISYDDPFYITENSHVNGGITPESVVWAFTSPLGANWHPLTSLSHMMDCELFALNPFWHHLTSLLFHTVNTLLLFYVLKSMTGAIWQSAFVAAVFALHPLHVESVAWVSERKDVLSVFFWMLTLIAYKNYAKRPAAGRYLLVVLSLSLGLMAKPMLVTLPFVLLLMDYWPLGRLQWSRQNRRDASSQPQSVGTTAYGAGPYRLIVEKLPLFILAAVSGAITYIVQQSEGAMELGEKFSLSIRLSNALVSYLGYVGKMLYPSGLAILYPHPGDGLPMWQPIVSLLALAVISAGVIYTARRRRYLTVGWFWYLGTLVPVIGLVQVGNQAMADRYTYLPSIGISIMAAWGAAELVANRRWAKIAPGLSAGLILAILLICTRQQVSYWKNTLTLYKHTLEVTENNFVMHDNYAVALNEEAGHNEAVIHFSEALRINPLYFKAHNGLGRASLAQGKIEKAIACFNEALRLKPDYPNAHYNLGMALQKQGKLAQAIEKWQKALQLKPLYPNAHYNLGLALTEQGEYDEAIKHFNSALEAKPNWPEAHYNLGAVYYRQGRLHLAVEQCRKALRPKPDYIRARITLAHTLVELGKIQPAVEHYYRVLQLEPDNVYVMKNLAWIFAAIEDVKLRNPDEAVKLAQRACELTGYNQLESLDTLAVAYAAAGNFPQAIKTAEYALELAVSAGKKQVADEIQKKLHLYKAGRAYRWPLPKASPD